VSYLPDEIVIGAALLTIVVGVAVLAAQAVRSRRDEDRDGNDDGLFQ
jgi:hypothetical protein